MVTHPNDADEEEGTAVDVHVDLPSVITVSVETAVRGVPAADLAARSPHDRRAPTTPLAQAPVRVPAGSGADEDEDRSLSLVTPYFDSERMASVERAISTASAEHSPALEEPDTRMLGDERSPADDEGETTLLRGGEPGGRAADDEKTLDPRAALSAKEPSVQTASPATPHGEGVSARDEAVAHGLPPMRPRFDSEAARQWAPWHEQPEEARAALAANHGAVVSPVSTGTEVLPRSTIQQAFRLLESPATSLAPDPRPPSPSPRAFPVAQTPSLPLEPPHDPVRPVEPTSSRSRSGMRATSSTAAKRGMSPVAVFVIAFLVTTAVFGGAVAARWFGWFSFGASGAPVTTPAPPATESGAPRASSALPTSHSPPTSGAASASSSAAAPAPSASDGASASSSAAAPAPSASSSRTRRPGGVTRPRGSPRTPRP